ncbi:CHAT domain-containing protein [Streptomyces sp. NPDC001552]|uniref:CHAT domain-containing protein n=1 Tax=Streptomyces sp. NPDC001552 TaxID=3364587 RepID=UPI003691E5A8
MAGDTRSEQAPIPGELAQQLEAAAQQFEDSRYDPVALVQLRNHLAKLASTHSTVGGGVGARLLRLLAETSTRTGAHNAAYEAIVKVLGIADLVDQEARDSARLALASTGIDAGRLEDALTVLAESRRPTEGAAGVTLATYKILVAQGRRAEAVQGLQDLVEGDESPSVTLAVALHTLGIALDESGQSEEALSLFTRALETLGDGYSDWQSSLHNSKSVALLKLGCIDEAATEADEAIARADSASDTAVALMSRANACSASGQTNLALHFYHQGLVAEGSSESRALEVTLLNNIATCYLSLGQPILYVKYLVWALDVAEELGDRRSKALALCNLASMWDPYESRVMLTEAYAIYFEIGDRAGQVGALHHLATAVQRDGFLDDALDHALEALKIAEEVGEPQLLCACHGKVGSLLKERGDVEQAWESFAQSLAWSEELRRETNVATVRLHLVEHVDTIVDQAIDLAATEAERHKGSKRQQWLGRLFEVLERARARVLADQMSSGSAIALESLSPDMRDSLRVMTNRVRMLRDIVGRFDAQKNENERKAASKELKLARRQLASTQAYLEQSNPRFGALESTVPVDLVWLASSVAEDVAIVEFANAGGDLASITYLSGEFRIARHGAMNKIRELDGKLREACLSTGPDSAAVAIAEQLGDLVLRPILEEPSFGGVRHLLVVPAPEAFSVPLDAYRFDGAYIFERFTVSYLPSVSVARYLGPCETARGAVVLGDPDGTLPYARQEAQEIAEILDPFMDCKFLLGPDATKEILLRYSSSSSNIHIASHAAFVPEAPDFARITLAGGDRDPDRNLEVADIMRLNLSSAIVVLSGCDTGLGTTDAANEIIGLVRAFLCAGASTVVATRWPINDTSASEFMRFFYRYMIDDEMHPTEALRNARFDHMRLGGYTHPAHWAPFVVFGIPPGIQGTV